MKNSCADRKDQLLEAAFAETVAPELQEHLRTCVACSEELAALRVKRERLDALLALVPQEAEPSPGFHARVLAAAQASSPSASRIPHWRSWVLAGIAATTLAILVLSALPRWQAHQTVPESDLAAAQKLAEFRAPSDVFLEIPGHDFLRTTPKLGDSYLRIPAPPDTEMPKEKRR